MNKSDRAEVCRYVRQLADTLGLQGWTFTIYYGTADDGASATCVPIYGRKLADIHLCEDFRILPPDTQRHVLAHELMHCHFAASQNYIRLELLKHLGQQGYDLFYGAWLQMHEYAIDGVTDGIAKTMPIITWKK